MLSQDSSATQSSLETDLDKLISSIRTREQDYFKILDFTSRVLLNRNEIESNIYIHDEIHKYRKLIQEIRLKEREHMESDKSIINKYKDQSVADDKIILLRRVVFRILEIIHSTLNQVVFKMPTVSQEYLRFKLVCHKIMSQNNKERVYLIVKAICEHQTAKINRCLSLLSSITLSLENGSLDDLQKMQTQISGFKQDQKQQSMKQVKCLAIDYAKKYKIKVKERVKEQNKQTEVLRSAQLKRAKQIMDHIKGVVQINRQDFVQDYLTHFQQQQSEQLYQALLNRNKINNKQIIEFAHKKNKIQHKIRSSTIIQQVKLTFTETNKSQGDLKIIDENKKICFTTRKNIFQKMKENDYKQRTLTSQLFKKINREENRFRLRTSNKQRDISNKINTQQKCGIVKTIQNVITQNQQLKLKAQLENCQDQKEKLPVLNKRACSVDQNYKKENSERPDSQSSKTMSNSIKLNEELKKKGKYQKSEMLPNKIRIQLKTVGHQLFSDFNKKLLKMTEFNKQLCL